MDTFRLILFLIGSVIVVAIYLYTRKASGKPFVIKPLQNQDNEKEPLVKDPETEEEIAEAVRDKRYATDQPDDDAISRLSETLSQGVQEKFIANEAETVPTIINEGDAEPLVIVMTIMAKPENLFNGADIFEAALANGFVHGDMNIFHFYPEQEARPAICSMANAIEPGFFEITDIEQVHTPGLTLFTQLTGSVESRDAFDQTVKLGQALAQQLQGDLCDETRSVLTMQTIEHLKEKVEAHIFKARMNQIQKHRH